MHLKKIGKGKIDWENWITQIYFYELWASMSHEFQRHSDAEILSFGSNSNMRWNKVLGVSKH